MPVKTVRSVNVECLSGSAGALADEMDGGAYLDEDGTDGIDEEVAG